MSYNINRRRIVKAKLVEHHGGKCIDCYQKLPPYVLQFDHRDPAEKSFNLSSGGTIAYHKQLEESLKCDLVCANCHADRTHKQRCPGCEYCQENWQGDSYGGKGIPSKIIKLCSCGSEMSSKSKTCKQCFLSNTKIDWPSIEELKLMLENSNFSQVSKKLGVSDNAIRNRLKNHS